MRNLKRALSLGLTATMISGLMVMGSSAASYADVTSEQNQEAIEVLKAVDIMVGDEKGNFNPEAKVTRNEMAVVMSNLMAYNVASYKDTSPFTDVPEWAEPYVAACYTNGITSGYDAKTYGGNDSVTTAQAALMVMKALGYFQYQSDFGADWQLSTVAQGNKIDLFDDVDSGVKEAMTRNDLAQLVLNALESGTVEADDDTIKFENGDTTVTAGKVKYNFITSGKDYAYAINDKLATDNNGEYSKGSIVELGEKLYSGDLTKEDGYLDANGYVAYIDESAVTYDYAYVLSMGTDDDQYGKGDNKGTTVYARLVLTDGTMVKVETDVKNGDTSLNNHLVSYTVDKNDVYSLSDRSSAKISTDTDLKIENGVAGMNISFNSKERYTANSNTIFVVADTDEDSYDDYDFTVYTGVKNVPDIDGRAETEVVVATEKDSNVAKVVYIEDADTAGTGEVIFAEANPKAKRVKDTEIGNWYEINAVVGGEIVTLQVKENSTAADKLVKNVAAGVVALKSVTENADGLVTSVKLYDGYNDGDGYVTGVGTEKAEKSTVMLKSIDQINDSNARYAWTDDVVVVRYDYKGDFNISRISSIKDDDNDGYIAVLDGDVITGICVLEKDDKGPQKPQEEKGLALNSLSFSDKGMKINFTNNSGAEFQTGAKADVVVKNSKGTQVCSIKGVQVTDGSVADKASATITFSEYTAVPSTTGEYTVTLTITAGHGTFTVTDVLGTI